MEFSTGAFYFYQDPSNKTTCYGEFPASGTDVCSDIIEIPTQSVQANELRIYTTKRLILCEVEIYAGRVTKR